MPTLPEPVGGEYVMLVAPLISVYVISSGELCHCHEAVNALLAVSVTLVPAQTPMFPPALNAVGELTVICKTPLAQVAEPAHDGAPTGVVTHA